VTSTDATVVVIVLGVEVIVGEAKLECVGTVSDVVKVVVFNGGAVLPATLVVNGGTFVTFFNGNVVCVVELWAGETDEL